MLSAFAVLILVTAQQAAQPEPTPAWGLPLHGEEAELFLRTAKIVSIKIYKIDASRAFRNHKELRREGSLEHFSRRVLASLRALTEDDLEERLGRWLTKGQLKALWVRRNLILELADHRVAELGEDAVFFD